MKDTFKNTFIGNMIFAISTHVSQNKPVIVKGVDISLTTFFENLPVRIQHVTWLCLLGLQETASVVGNETNT